MEKHFDILILLMLIFFLDIDSLFTILIVFRFTAI